MSDESSPSLAVAAHLEPATLLAEEILPSVEFKEGERQMRDKDLLERIMVDPKVMVGKPVIRGTRIPVALILKMLGQGIPVEEILREYPRLEKVDIEAAIAYAAHVVEHEEVFPLLVWGELVPA